MAELNNQRIPSIALFLQGVRHYERELLRGISDYGKENGPWQFYRSLPYLFGKETDPSALIQRWQPDGIIIRESRPHRYDKIIQTKLPAIYSPTTECSDRLANIVVDDLAVGRIAADHLYETGIRNFAFCGISTFFWSRLRGIGFAGRLQDYGLPTSQLDSKNGREYFSWDRSHARFKTWLEQLPKPVGILCCTDDFCQLVQEACLSAHLRIPEEVALIGVGNDESICDLVPVSLSSVKLNIRRGGYDAAAYLDHQLKGGGSRPTARENVVIQVSGVAVRPSTDATEISDREVAKAIGYIRQHIRSRLSVEEVVRAAGLSRRRLYQRFKDTTGKNIYTYIQDRRLEEFCRMLTESELTVSEIAYAMGESSATNVARQFKARYGETPVNFRSKHRSGRPHLVG